MAGIQSTGGDPGLPPSAAVARGSGRGLRELSRSPGLTLAAIRLVRAAAPRNLIAVVALQLVAAGLVGVQLVLAKTLIGELVTLSDDDGASGWSLAPAFAGLITANIGSGVVSAWLGQQQRLMADLVGHHTMNGIIDVASRAGLRSYEDAAFHDHLERARNAALYRPVEIVEGLTSLVSSVLTSLGIAIALLTLEPILVPLILVAGLPVLLASLWNSRRSYQFEYSMTVHAREHMHLMEVLTGPEYAKELRIFSTLPFLRRRYDALTDERIRRLTEFLRGRLFVSIAGNVATGLGTAIALGSLLWLLVSDRTDVATAATAALALQLLGTRLLVINASVGRIVESGLFLDDFRGFLAIEDRFEAPAAAPAPGTPEVPAEPFTGVHVEHLSFTYPQTGRQVLDDVSLELNPGEIVALVGANGSGKTTLVKLLCKLYAEQDAGRIVLNGRDVREVDHRTLRARMTVLFQDFLRYELTVGDNIVLGRPEASDDRERMVEAARRAGAHDFIERLPNGYETRLGRRFHGGLELSGGQWQRLALARAFFRGGDVLIMDEPTAALDPRAEHDFFQQVSELAADRAVLLISHRFSSVRMADRIYVMQDGRIIEHGTHQELMGLSGVYAELYDLQATAYFGDDAAPRA
ncbi:MAG TPA: ABC transporter ATP-binding protein [Solirubrobacteraceae bacterium]|nr:ABC transporter ATP-binding protein [Solirubrobacteraceae bacterium]